MLRTFDNRGWRLRICKFFEITSRIYRTRAIITRGLYSFTHFLKFIYVAFMYCDLWPYDLSFWTETWLSHCGQTRIGRTWGPFIHYVKGYLAKNLLSYYIYCAFNAATMESATAAGAGSKIRDIIAWLELSRCHTTFSSQKLTVTHTKMNYEIFDSNWPYVRIACHSN